MRLAVPIVYGILLLIGWWVIADRQRPSAEALVAAHNLAPNHRLRSGDLVAAASNTQYVTRGVKKDERIKPGDIVGFPQLNLEAGAVPVVFTVGAGMVDSGDIDAGSQVQICKGQEMKIKSAPVQAAICDPIDTVCWIVVAISADQSANLAELFGKEPSPNVKPVRANSNC
jgi:hypothetical protein